MSPYINTISQYTISSTRLWPVSGWERAAGICPAPDLRRVSQTSRSSAGSKEFCSGPTLSSRIKIGANGADLLRLESCFSKRPRPAGAIVATGLTYLMGNLLYKVSPRDPRVRDGLCRHDDRRVFFAGVARAADRSSPGVAELILQGLRR
jgi:hypothetical protein